MVRHMTEVCLAYTHPPTHTHTGCKVFKDHFLAEDLPPLLLPPAAAAPGVACGAAASWLSFFVSALVLATFCFTTSVSATVLPVCADLSSTSASPSLALFCASSSLVSVPSWSAWRRRLTAPAISTAVHPRRVQRRGQGALDVDHAALEERLQLGGRAQRRGEQRELVALLGVVVDRVVRRGEHLVDRKRNGLDRRVQELRAQASGCEFWVFGRGCAARSRA